jgi:hypothetical protein
MGPPSFSSAREEPDFFRFIRSDRYITFSPVLRDLLVCTCEVSVKPQINVNRDDASMMASVSKFRPLFGL